MKLRAVRPWFAVSCDLDRSPGITRLRNMLSDPLADLFFVRATAFCKSFESTGHLAAHWPVVAEFCRWPRTPDEMRAAFRSCELVSGDQDELADWHELNGWICERLERERRRKRREYAHAIRVLEERRKRRSLRKVTQSGSDRTGQDRGVGDSAETPRRLRGEKTKKGRR